ncbi:hypothetical protein CHGG_04304 [Chaetomium globosum CBS 148.51]|uniref:NACHT domain-containing protein n=1 Tax=Chaetomium globosum (strain ATCC 6205 / CBS 148.51 / DSM 1962 / NBRC 6347 / NRRL 1970) TaxID=306901 RepID=Q2H1P2_CHAGB|nr:uncharacterized protein CHGG_04304 [Chaetomium globosum CBS 148.51]EAQ87685.1 hypothetical protein CHGG_04304 [Chaetomium globosum CBS 148.51]
MEPVSAVGVAAAALQFLDFGSRLLSTSRQIYRSPSGRTARQVTLSTITNDLAHILAHVEQATASITPTSLAYHQLVSLSTECKDLIAPLNDALAALGKDGDSVFMYDEGKRVKEKSVLKTLRSALEAIWNQAEIEETIAKLRDMERRVTTAVIFAIWDGTRQSEERQIQFSRQLDEMTTLLLPTDPESIEADDVLPGDPQPLATAVQPEIVTTAIFNRVVDTLNDKTLPESLEIYNELVGCLWSRKQLPTPPEWISSNSSRVFFAEPEAMRRLFTFTILNSLAFETMEFRQEAIPEAFQRTFTWIFKGGANLPSFSEWLETEVKKPYWITGKPGSGKSTLMSYIIHHQSLLKHLHVWARGLPLIIARYYAWISGAHLQKSREGLMRTILHQVLSEENSLIPCVAPRRWALFSTLRAAVEAPPWSTWEVQESFDALLSECDKSFRLAVFIDGLDEFDLLPVDVIELIQHINARDGIKICVAGRPWMEFNDAFRGNPMLLMQDLNMVDITHIVKTKLEENIGFSELQNLFPTEAAHLIDEVARKSNGVILWVGLVVKSLLVALSEGDGLAELQVIIDGLPSRLSDLYDAIWASISPTNVTKSAEMLAIFEASQRPLDCLTLWIADGKLPLSFNILSTPLSQKGNPGVIDIMRRRLDSRTRGILEISSSSGTVDFLHRSASDWASKPEVWERISRSICHRFDPNLSLAKAEALKVPLATWEEIRNGGDSDPVRRCLWYASQVVDTGENRILLTRTLDKFDENVANMWTGLIRGEHWSSRSEACTNTFLGLAARFHILPYLREKLAWDPKLISRKTPKKRISLLENAVFDSLGYVNERRVTIDAEQRLSTIAFLLEHGANPREKTTEGLSVLETVRKKAEMRGAAGSGPDENWIMGNWTEVETMMLAAGGEGSIKKLFGFFSRS